MSPDDQRVPEEAQRQYQPPADDAEPPRAVEKTTRWWSGGWIWAVPIAALMIVGYLAIREFTSRGPLVTVTFPSAEGVKVGNTQVQYEGLQVGSVEEVKLQKDMHHVDIQLRLNADMDGHLGPGTRFWITGHHPDFADLSTLKNIISGPYIGIDPHPGKQLKHYEGLAAAPAVKETIPGVHVTLSTATLGTLQRGSNIYYRDLKVGTVDDTHLEPNGKGFRIDAFVWDPYDHLVHRDTRFWDESAVQVSMSGPGPRVQFHSIPALFAGAIGFETPDAPGPPAADGAHFTLYASKEAAENAPDAQSVRYRVVFNASQAGGLDAGAPVQLAGQRVGTVESSTLEYQTDPARLLAVVTLAIEPHRIALDGQQWQPNPRPQMDALLQSLIARGLRASVGKSIPVVGAPAVDLGFVSKATPASLGAGDVPAIPTGPGSDISGILANIGGFSAKLDSLPLDDIANEIHQTTSRIAELSQSPEVTQTLRHLDDTVANIDHVSHEASAQIGPILARLHRVADEAQSAVAGAQRLLNANSNTVRQPGTAGIGEALYELSRAARSLRELADYLDRHPEALLKGKG